MGDAPGEDEQIQASTALVLFLDAIRREVLDAGWQPTPEQIHELHGELVVVFEKWLHRNGRLP